MLRGMATTHANPKAPSSYLRRYGIDSLWAHLALNLASVLMLTLAFPKPGWSAMAFFAPVPVGVLAMRSTRLWTLAWTTFLIFGAWWALRIGWLSAISGGAPWGVGFVLGLYMAVMVVALAKVQRRFRASLTLTLPIFWVAQEAIRSVWPWGGFAWFTLGSSQAMWKPGQGITFPSGYLVQSADLFGVLTVSFLVAMTSGLIVDLISRPMTKRNEEGQARVRRTVVVAACLWAVCLGGAMVHGVRAVWRAESHAVVGPSITVIQTNVPQSNKGGGTTEDLLAKQAADWDRLFELTDDALASSPETRLVVWPETMVLRPINDEYLAVLDDWIAAGARAQEIGTLEGDEELRARVEHALDMRRYRERLSDYCSQNDLTLIAGGRAQFVQDDPRLMNSAFFIEPGAGTFRRYSKQQLVPFGEYVPGPHWIRNWFHKYLSPYEHDYTLREGEGPVVFEVGGPASRSAAATDEAESAHFRVATPICFEDLVGHLCRDMVYAGDGTKRVDVLVNLTNDGWFAGSQQGYQHLQIATLRCIENRVPMVRSVNTGNSGFIDSLGRVTQVVTTEGKSQGVDGFATAEVSLDGRTTLYAKVGEAGPMGAFVTACLLFFGTLVPRQNKAAGRSSG